MKNLKWIGLFAITLALTAYALLQERESMQEKNGSREKDRPDAHPKQEITLHVAGNTDPGKKRPNNEDTYFIDEPGRVYGIFDGMGGMAAGEEASRIAKEQVQAYFKEKRHDIAPMTDLESMKPLFHEAFTLADGAIRAFAEEKNLYRMGTTAIVAVQLSNALYLANLGDTRAYLVRQGEPIKRLSKDHTVAAMLVEIGEITEEEARDPGARNRLLASLGDMGQNKPYYSQVAPLQAGDRVILCSDGLWDMVPDTDIADIVSKATTPDAAVTELITRANAAGGSDNITVVALFA